MMYAVVIEKIINFVLISWSYIELINDIFHNNSLKVLK